MTRIVRRRAAREDLLDQYAYIVSKSEEAAERFLGAAEVTMARLAASPRIGSPAKLGSEAMGDVRHYPIDGFRHHLVFYRPIENGIEVLRLLHAARDLPALLDSPAGEAGDFD